MSGDFLILGVAGKIGPSLALRLRRAVDAAGFHARVIGVDQSLGPDAERQFREARIETICADLLDPAQVAQLPEAENVVFMAGRKFGSTGAASLTWAVNAWLPALVARRYRNSRIVAFSSGNVYPMTPIVWGGATEATPPQPIGEYAQSVLARERLFEHFSLTYGTAVCLLRLNYAIDLRYGVLLDIGQKVYHQSPLSLGMGAVNVIWQGDVNSACLRSFAFCQSPPTILNLTGPETLSVRAIARRFGELLSVEPVFEGVETEVALLNNAGRYHRLLGYPSVSADEMIEWVARWIQRDGATLDKPTHFDARDGKF
ncbi:MAG: NAD-dependent epimerase/dehydratase family protein [Bryobacteraceae bacterium]